MRRLAPEDLRSCCASAAWVAAVGARGPYQDVAALTEAGRAALAELAWDDVEEALAAHPRIGERPAGDGREASWSRREQAGTAGAGPAVLDAIHAGNAEYERRFGHVYLVCATGLGAAELLDLLRERLGNDRKAEREVVREELGKIVSLRLEKLWEGR
ncbi:2-oxo-4-hydroxy-4-carboxy-5-ureidoimidazoline decarboxylase [Microbispora sp. RL4-1S]|uniref:2-oxo-4-hydroxy-4-carboxy-5-ureidoimidazoline decarboxylase n=1 Tax=Microbispora oryzae TaxID=2806554 RepID=A0A940WJ00_9ACTN|nr:2-oxo-4-hydroxy-4-carboxy-5-ureidoimidazoline decarboxylase [Microbispora oryzae]MBP2702435.1 2-oxo-4-hydroxy-4-carboxy-5-ureidoimidazoline decarboxylase [Microbispora oryzae]